MKLFTLKSAAWLSSAICTLPLFSCKDTTPPDTKYIADFHAENFARQLDMIAEDSLALYVDYSTCIAEGMKTSEFYVNLVPSFVQATKTFHSIKGDVITREEPADTYNRLLNIEEVNFADLKSAAEQIASGDRESALLTDGEYYNPNRAGANPNNPYLANAFKTWLRRGHDIFVISEPYEEQHKGKTYGKKRFYFLFTDTRLKNNIYDRIISTASIDQFPGVEVFHLSADHPNVLAEGNSAKPNELLAAGIKPYGSFEVEDWSVGWKPINNFIMGAADEKTGEPLPNGGCLIGGLQVDRNSFGGYEIEDVDIKVYDLNEAYMDYYLRRESGEDSIWHCGSLPECVNFLAVDHDEFARSGVVNIYFDLLRLDNAFLKYGRPYNYFKIDLFITKTKSAFADHASMFKFDLLGDPDATNSSVVTSIEQCLVDKDLESQVKRSPFYTIYVKSNKY